MDGVDRALLDALRLNARATYAELGRVVGLSAPSVHERVGKLEAAGVITGYHAAVAPEALGYSIGAIISVFLSGAGPAGTATASSVAVEDAVAEVDAVEDLWFVAGEEALIIKVRCPDVGELERTIRELNDIHGVGHTRTTVVLSTRFEDRVRPANLPSAAAPDADVPALDVPQPDVPEPDVAEPDLGADAPTDGPAGGAPGGPTEVADVGDTEGADVPSAR